jgi:predicted ATPase
VDLDLLSPQEQALFARLAVFDGGCGLDAMEHVCGGDLDTLQSLVEKSLVRRTGDRFWMLETIREYATDRLEQTDDHEAIRRRHAEHFLALGESANLSAESEGPEFPELVRPEMEQFWVMNDSFEGVRWLAAVLERSLRSQRFCRPGRSAPTPSRPGSRAISTREPD